MAVLGYSQLEPKVLCPAGGNAGLLSAVLRFLSEVLGLFLRVSHSGGVTVLVLAMWIQVRESFTRVWQRFRLEDLHTVSMREANCFRSPHEENEPGIRRLWPLPAVCLLCHCYLPGWPGP